MSDPITPESLAKLDLLNATRQADLALQEGRCEDAIAAADFAIQTLLQPGLGVADLIRLTARGSNAEGLLRYDRDAVARRKHLHQPIAIRWEALRRLGRTQDARLMRMVCIKHFPDRASVWATAGNQALDEGDLKSAEHYFEECLRRDQNWTAALAGTAILAEMRKDWPRALDYRTRVITVERSIEHDDPASLQRLIRYGAALGRLNHWPEAGVVLRHCVKLGAYESLPAERPVLRRVFSRDLYSPALFAQMLTQVPAPIDSLDDAERLAIDQAQRFTRAFDITFNAQGMDARELILRLAMCAWLAGDDAAAYALFDEAEVHAEADLMTQYLLMCSAAAIGAPELPSIQHYAREAATRASDLSQSDADTLFFARLTLRQLSNMPAEAEVLEATNLPAFAGMDLGQQLRALVSFRAAQLAAGRSTYDTALASAPLLAALALE